jgi:hypothetical protein
VSDLPGCGVEFARPSTEVPGAIEVGCGCGTTTILAFGVAGSDGQRIDALDNVPAATIPQQEIAVTCDGCQSAHWLTIVPAEVPGE